MSKSADGDAITTEASYLGAADGDAPLGLLAFKRDLERRREPAHAGEPKPQGLGSTRVSVVIPTLNEAENLPHIMPLIPSWVDEVLIVDGHSTDDTIAVAQELRHATRVILQDGRGKGNALACGFAAARGDIIVMLDADGSTDPTEISDFVAPLIAGADFAKGSRCLPGGGSTDISRLRHAGNTFLTKTVNALYGRRYSDLCYGYNAFWAHCLPYMNVDCDGFEVETLIHVRVARANLDVREVPSMEHARIHGVSNLNAFRDGWRVMRTILTNRFGHKVVDPAAGWEGPRVDEITPTIEDRAGALAIGGVNW